MEQGVGDFYRLQKNDGWQTTGIEPRKGKSNCYFKVMFYL
jgi:hypothetical protein